MTERGKTIIIGVVALVIGAALGAGWGMMQVDGLTKHLNAARQEKDQAVQTADRMRKTNDEAAKKYGQTLGKQVSSVRAADDSAKLIDSARAILATRDGYRASLDGVRGSMDSQFDALAAELGNATPSANKVKQILDSLKAGWPEKEKAMEAAARKLLVDLGLAQAPAAPKPAAAAPAPAPAEKK
jgi:hypothetical protein